MQNNKNDKVPNTFVDGVPVKISEKYKPPRKITLPFSCQNCTPSETLFTEYDFKLEKNVVSKLTEWKKTRAEEKKKREEKQKGTKEVRQGLESFHNLSLKDTDEVVEAVEPRKQACNPKLDDSILIPVTAKANSPLHKPASALFNFRDFESDNSSPFDNMELKTINDMEVLASILTPDNMKQSFNNNCNIIDKELNKNGSAMSKDSGTGQGPVNGFDKLVPSSFNASAIPTGYVDPYGPVDSARENYQFYNYQINKFSNQCGGGVAPVPGPSVGPSETQNTGNLVEDADFCPADVTSPKTNSKSVPDIMNELNRELEENRNREIAAENRNREIAAEKRNRELAAEKRNRELAAENRNREVAAELRIRTSPPPIPVERKLPDTSRVARKTSRRLLDPTSTLKPDLLILAHHITEMGFPLARVARACEYFDGDGKKIIEFLLQVQSLEDKDYPGDMVERAFILHGFRTEEAINYLNAMMVLLDLGFEERKVEEALRKTNSDRDKALDLLIS